MAILRASQGVWWQRIHLPVQEMQETWARSLGQEDALEREMATHPSILVWKIPRIEEPGGLQSRESQTDTTEHAHAHTHARTHTHTHAHTFGYADYPVIKAEYILSLKLQFRIQSNCLNFVSINI